MISINKRHFESICKTKEIRDVKENFEKQVADKMKDCLKAVYSYSWSKPKTKDTFWPIAGGDVMVSSESEIASLLNKSVFCFFTNDNLPISES